MVKCSRTPATKKLKKELQRPPNRCRRFNGISIRRRRRRPFSSIFFVFACSASRSALLFEIEQQFIERPHQPHSTL